MVRIISQGDCRLEALEESLKLNEGKAQLALHREDLANVIADAHEVCIVESDTEKDIEEQMQYIKKQWPAGKEISKVLVKLTMSPGGGNLQRAVESITRWIVGFGECREFSLGIYSNSQLGKEKTGIHIIASA